MSDVFAKAKRSQVMSRIRRLPSLTFMRPRAGFQRKGAKTPRRREGGGFAAAGLSFICLRLCALAPLR